MDPYEELGIIYNADGDTLTRLKHYPSITTEIHNSLPNQSVFTKDFALNTTHKTSLRLYKPINPPPPKNSPSSSSSMGADSLGIPLPVLSSLIHDFCTNMGTELPAVVLSLEYRLAPESRLPAAYEDGVEALIWIQNQALSENHMLMATADFSRCYIMGNSSGGNVTYHVGLRGLCLDLEPMVIRGYIFLQPYFSGEQRSESELRLGGDDTSKFPLIVSDVLWDLSLPKGCNRDHEYCNPLVGGSYKDKIGLLGRCLVSGCDGDLLVDYQKEFVKMLEGYGVNVVCWFEKEGYHGMELYEPEKAKAFFLVLKDFVSG